VQKAQEVLISTPQVLQQYLCRYCGKEFAKRSVQKRHEEESCKNNLVKQQYACDQCDHKPFDTKNGLSRHVRNKHMATVPHFPCDVCKKMIPLPIVDRHYNYCKFKVLLLEGGVEHLLENEEEQDLLKLEDPVYEAKLLEEAEKLKSTQRYKKLVELIEKDQSNNNNDKKEEDPFSILDQVAETVEQSIKKYGWDKMTEIVDLELLEEFEMDEEGEFISSSEEDESGKEEEEIEEEKGKQE
jgi:DNA-directed RNA polymerase subunit RPC12/RpoP